MATGEWVANPHKNSSLSHVLPYVDERITNKTLKKIKLVVTNITTVVNLFIYNIANMNATQGNMGFYYNQSRPLMLPLCLPFGSQLQERQCTHLEVSSANASTVCFS